MRRVDVRRCLQAAGRRCARGGSWVGRQAARWRRFVWDATERGRVQALARWQDLRSRLGVDQPPGAQQALPSASLHRLVHAAPSRGLRATLWLMLALVGTLLAWALMAQLDIVATAPGKLVPSSQVKIVQAAEAGIVREILVRDGDAVRAGQLLLRLDATESSATASQLERELQRKRLTVRAIDAALAQRAFVMRAGDDASVYGQIRAQFEARSQALADALAQEEQAAARASSERLAAQMVRDKLKASLPTLQQSAESYDRLKREGFVGELLANEKMREAIEGEQDLQAQEATLAALDAAIAQAHQRARQHRSSDRAQLLVERSQAQADVERLTQEVTKQGFRNTLLEVRAPQDGVVQNLATYTPGAVVHAGSVLLQVVPQGDVLRAEAALANEDVGFVEVGQRVRLKFAAYPFQKYGLLEGRIVQLSADAQEPDAAARSTGAPQIAPPLTYKAVIELGAQSLAAPNGRELPLTPGMALSAEIHQGRRSVMEYLLSPVQKISAEAARER